MAPIGVLLNLPVGPFHVGHFPTETPTPEPALAGVGLPTLAGGLVAIGVALPLVWYAATRR